MATSKRDDEDEDLKRAVRSVEDAATDIAAEAIRLTGAVCRSGAEFAFGSLRVLGDTVIDIDKALYRGVRGRTREDGGKEGAKTSPTDIADRVSGSLSDVAKALGRAADESASVVEKAGEEFRTAVAESGRHAKRERTTHKSSAT